MFPIIGLPGHVRRSMYPKKGYGGIVEGTWYPSGRYISDTHSYFCSSID
jgi:hypothetical protein